MKLQRWDMGHSGYYESSHGDVCMSYDVEKLEESNKELLDALKEIIEQTDGRNHSLNGQARAYSIARDAIAKAEGGEG